MKYNVTYRMFGEIKLTCSEYANHVCGRCPSTYHCIYSIPEYIIKDNPAKWASQHLQSNNKGYRIFSNMIINDEVKL